MWWLILIIVIIAAFAVPRFGAALLALLLVGGALFYLDSRRSDAERTASLSRIPASELEIVDLNLRPPQYDGGSYTLVGRLRNRSTIYTLTGLRLKLIMQDCLEPGRCETVSEYERSLYPDIPPGQARDLDELIFFSGLGEPRGTHQWDYQVLEIRGK